MTKALRFISVSHKNASVTQREKFYIAEEDKHRLVSYLSERFNDIAGLLLLVTCNRTEVYFESTTTSAGEIRDAFIRFQKLHPQVHQGLFVVSDTTQTAVKQLLKVASGLDSKVTGDAEIIYQIKIAYQFSVAHHLQGSLLERAMQSVFKCHKRISNETHFRDGTTSVAYKSLKMIQDVFGKEKAQEAKILFIGAGDIVNQLFKYNSKFNFSNIYISNRTKSSALSLLDKYYGTWYPWAKVLENKFEDFDVIIAAAGNCHHLIKSINEHTGERLMIDLALPGNIAPEVTNTINTIFCDLDTISHELEETKEKRLAAMQLVEAIQDEELHVYEKWLETAPMREILANYKTSLNGKVISYLEAHETNVDEKKVKLVTDRVMRNLLKEPNLYIPDEIMNTLIEEKAYF
ncbi:MAG: hypothetical protein HKN52_08615 [Eudoraea sp.]|nr:hypothetical protein [Eudoraea sp.]